MILSIDTSLGTSVALVGDDLAVLAEQHSDDSRGHAEAIGSLMAGVFADAGASAADTTGVAVGMGPGPFTGLRVGIAAARVFAAARGLPLLTVPSHVAVAEAWASARGAVGSGESGLLVLTDARRREQYWSLFGRDDAGLPVLREGPGLVATLDVDALAARLGEPTRLVPERVSAAALGRAALRRRAAGLAGPGQPLYLREPDAVPSARPKRVSC